MKSKAINPWAAIDAVMQQEAEPTGPGWFTTKDFADRYKVSESAARQRLRTMFNAGRVKQWRGRTGATNNTTYKYHAS